MAKNDHKENEYEIKIQSKKEVNLFLQMPSKNDKQRMQDLIESYKAQIEKELGPKVYNPKITSKEYQEFKSELMPGHLTFYEKVCNLSEKILKINPDEKNGKKLTDNINTTHLDITPSGVTSFSFLAPIFIMVFGSLFAYLFFQSTFFVLFFLITGISLIIPLGKIPEYIANSWRLKASNQMVLC